MENRESEKEEERRGSGYQRGGRRGREEELVFNIMTLLCSSGAPSMKSGTAEQPTRLLGRNWENCQADSQKTSKITRTFF
jgi:hypothetical protein